MPPIRPSQCAMQQRADGGPFLRFDNSEARGLSEGELEALESGEYDEMTSMTPHSFSTAMYLCRTMGQAGISYRRSPLSNTSQSSCVCIRSPQTLDQDASKKVSQ